MSRVGMSVLLAVACSSTMFAQRGERELQGAVMDGREPLRGAVIHVHDEGTDTEVTYITAADGKYRFPHLSSRDDYRVWVVWRGKKSKEERWSSFDNKKDKVMNFEMKPY